MPLSLRRWRASHLSGAWILYWVALAAIVFWRPAMIARRISQLPPGRSNASATFGDGGFDIKMVVDNAPVYQGHAGYGTVLLWLVVPPLLLWIVWLAMRPRPDAVRPAELRTGDPWGGDPVVPRDSVREGRERGSR